MVLEHGKEVQGTVHSESLLSSIKFRMPTVWIDALSPIQIGTLYGSKDLQCEIQKCMVIVLA